MNKMTALYPVRPYEFDDESENRNKRQRADGEEDVGMEDENAISPC